MLRRILCIVLVLLAMPCFGTVAYSASAYALIDGDTGELLISRNANTRRSMASTTKIMTALILCESGGLEQTITVTKKMVMVEGSSIGLRAGDIISRKNLLYGLMLESGNDAANVIAIDISGDKQRFAERMNKTARQIGMKNSNFVTPSGLDDKQHYSTAYDMALLTRYAMQNPIFAEVVGSTLYKAVYNNGDSYRTYSNHNRLLRSLEGCEGVKTGFTKKSGRCLVTSCTRNGKRLIAVTLGAPDDWNDHRALYEQGYSMYHNVTLDGRFSLKPVKVAGGKKTFTEVCYEPVKVCLKKDSEVKSVIQMSQLIFAPVGFGEKLGSIRYTVNGRTVAQVAITAKSSVPLAELQKSGIIDKLIMLLGLR